MIMNFRESTRKSMWSPLVSHVNEERVYFQLKTSHTFKDGEPAFLELLAKCESHFYALLCGFGFVSFIH